jgi:hypothetical protein
MRLKTKLIFIKTKQNRVNRIIGKKIDSKKQKKNFSPSF